MDREACLKWLRRQVNDGAFSLTLETISNESRKGSDELLTVKVPRRPQDKWYKSSVRAVSDAVERDMETLEASTQAYALKAFGKDGEFKDRFSFREINTDAEEAIDPTPNGLMKDLMMHNRDMARTMSDMYKAGTSYYERTLDRLAESHQHLMDDKLSTLELIERLKSGEFERRLELKREEATDEFRSNVIAKIMALLPVAVSKLTGKPIPGVGSESDHLIASFADTLRPEQLDSLMQILTPEQQVVILTLIDNVKKRQEEAKEAKEDKPKIEVVK